MHIAQEVPVLFEIFYFLTQWYKTKLRAIVPTNYFKPFILKFKTFIYISNSKIMDNFCKYEGNIRNKMQKSWHRPGLANFYFDFSRLDLSDFKTDTFISLYMMNVCFAFLQFIKKTDLVLTDFRYSLICYTSLK